MHSATWWQREQDLSLYQNDIISAFLEVLNF